MKDRKSKTFFFIIGLMATASFVGGSLFVFSYSDFTRKETVLTELALLLENCSRGNLETERKLYYDCLRNDMSALLKRSSLSQIMDALETLFVKEKRSEIIGVVACHDVAHIVGDVAVEQNNNIGSLITECSRQCGYGCIHGVALGALRRNGNLLYDLSSICEPFSNSLFPGQDSTACYHGLGHGFGDLAQRDLAQALSFCDYIISEVGQIECATGVLMEIIEVK